MVSEHRLRRELRFRELMVAAVLAQCVGNGLVAVALAWLGFGVWALVWGTLARHAVFALAVIAFAPPPPPDAGRREAADLLGAGAGFSALALFGALSGQALILTIAGTLGAAAVGLYTRARALSVVTARLGPVLRNVLLPAMARRQRRIERLRTVHLNGVELLALAALPTSGLIALAAPEIVAVVLGDQWTGAVPALRILALGGALHAVNAVHVPLIRALGAVYREAGRRALYMALLLGGAWFASRWGLLGVAAAVAAAQAVLHVELTHLALGLLGLRPAALLRRYAPALWVTLWACAALSFAAWAVRAAAWPALAALAAELAAWGGAAAAAAYFAPPFARPAFPHWCLERLDFQPMGAAGRWTRAALERLARRWPAPREAGPS